MYSKASTNYLSRGFGAVRPLGFGSTVQARGHSEVCKSLAVAVRGLYPDRRDYRSAPVTGRLNGHPGVHAVSEPW